jgi:hypothetical protein
MGEPVQVFTLTMEEAEILARARRLTPAEREKLLDVLRQMTSATAGPEPGRAQQPGRRARGNP